MICCFTSQMKGYWIFGGIRSNGYSTLFFAAVCGFSIPCKNPDVMAT